MNKKISIPKPCHEDWDNMLPEQQGRHCMACSKKVVDFTDWNEQEILHYLERHSHERVCGRFNKSQVETEREMIFPVILKSNVSVIKKIAAIILLCFGVLSSTPGTAQEKMGKVAYVRPQEPDRLLGEPAIVPADTTKPVQVDTARYEPQIMGMIKPYPPKKVKAAKKPDAKRNK